MKIDLGQKRITKNEARRGIYFDFEKEVKEPPFLIGILCEGVFDQRVLDPRLESAARAKDRVCDDLESVVEELVSRCQDQDRCLIAFSQHDRNVIHEHLNLDVGPFYRDARLIAKKWLNRNHRDHGIPYELKAMLKFIEYERKSHLGGGVQTKRVRAVLTGLATKRANGDYSKLKTGQKSGWTNLVEHNRVDCYGMRALVFETLGLPWTQD